MSSGVRLKIKRQLQTYLLVWCPGTLIRNSERQRQQILGTCDVQDANESKPTHASTTTSHDNLRNLNPILLQKAKFFNMKFVAKVGGQNFWRTRYFKVIHKP